VNVNSVPRTGYANACDSIAPCRSVDQSGAQCSYALVTQCLEICFYLHTELRITTANNCYAAVADHGNFWCLWCSSTVTFLTAFGRCMGSECELHTPRTRRASASTLGNAGSTALQQRSLAESASGSFKQTSAHDRPSKAARCSVVVDEAEQQACVLHGRTSARELCTQPCVATCCWARSGPAQKY